MYHAVQQGLRSGMLAGLLLVGLLFVDYGPATNLTTVARLFALDAGNWNKLIGAVLLVVLGALFGGLYAIIFRRALGAFHFILPGLATGLCWWVLLILLLATAIRHIQQSPYGMLLWFVISLFYGLTLASLYRQLQFQQKESGREPYTTRTI